MPGCIYASMHACVPVCIHACVHVYVYVYVYICVYVYLYIHYTPKLPRFLCFENFHLLIVFRFGGDYLEAHGT